MKYLSLDIETTSLQPSPENILMISMIVEDTNDCKIPVYDLPHFTCFIKPNRIEGEAYALAMNAWILDYISERRTPAPYPIFKDYDWTQQAIVFINLHFCFEKVTVAGKNVASFDIKFLPERIQSMLRHRVLDPGTLFVDWKKDDTVPNFELCKKRSGIDTPIAHDAREDAMDTIRIFRKFYI